MKALELISTIVTLTGVYLLSEQYLALGWSINATGDILWAVWGYLSKAYWLVLLQVILFFIAVNGLVNL